MQIRGDIPKRCAAHFICLRIIPDENRWLARLFINNAGGINMAKEDPNGKLKYSIIIATLDYICYRPARVHWLRSALVASGLQHTLAPTRSSNEESQV